MPAKKKLSLEPFYYRLPWYQGNLSFSQIFKCLRVWKDRRAQLKTMIEQDSIPPELKARLIDIYDFSEKTRKRISDSVHDLNRVYKDLQTIIVRDKK